MRGVLTEYEAILDLAGRAESYASLSWTTQTDDPVRGALLQKVTERQSALAQKAVFLDIEWANVPEEAAAALIDDPLLSRWRHWLIVSRRIQAPPALGARGEDPCGEVGHRPTGVDAVFRRDPCLHALRVERDDGPRGGHPPAALSSPTATCAAQAAGSLTRGLRGILRMAAFVTNTLAAEKSSDDRLRSYPTWISSRNMDNQVDDATVEALVHAVTSRYDIVARYYRLKKRLARAGASCSTTTATRRFRTPSGATRGARRGRRSLPPTRGFTPGWRRSHPISSKSGGSMPRCIPGKRGGAFSSSTVPSVHPTCF